MLQERLSIRVKTGGEQKEQSNTLHQWLDGRGIKAVLFDLDDTLIQTFAIINAYRQQYLDTIHPHVSHLTRSDLVELANSIESGVFQTHAVSPSRWPAIADSFSQLHPTVAKQVFMEPIQVFAHIYKEVPMVYPGTYEVLNAFKETGRRLGVVTHANKAWTELKLKESGLKDYFDYIEIVDEHVHKSSEHWKNAIDSLGVKPDEVLVIGDSLNGDILAAKQAGVIHTVLLPSQIPFYKTGSIPDDVLQASSISEVIPTLLQT